MNPTPAQSRILRGLHRGKMLLFAEDGGYWRDDKGDWLKVAQVRTMDILLANNWIETAHTGQKGDRHYWYYKATERRAA